MSGTLYIVATPIGNLDDLSYRVKEVLENVDIVLAEDTRVTLKLLNHLGFKKRLFSYTDHASEQQEEKILTELLNGKNFALVSDAGTPGISDPGTMLVRKIVNSDIKVVPVAGPCAVSTLLSVFGRPHQSYHFWGFFPTKRKKQKLLMESVESLPGIHVYFDSPFRVMKNLERFFLDKDHYHMVIGREMTKMHETFYRGTPNEVFKLLEQDKVKGEFCVGVFKEE